METEDERRAREAAPKKPETEQERRNRESAQSFKDRDADVRQAAGGSDPAADGAASPTDELAKVEGPVNADGPAKNSKTVSPADRARDGRPEAPQHGEPKT